MHVYPLSVNPIYPFKGISQAAQPQLPMAAMMQMMMNMQTSSQQTLPQRSPGLRVYERLQTRPGHNLQAKKEQLALEDAKPHSHTAPVTDEQANTAPVTDEQANTAGCSTELSVHDRSFLIISTSRCRPLESIKRKTKISQKRPILSHANDLRIHRGKTEMDVIHNLRTQITHTYVNSDPSKENP